MNLKPLLSLLLLTILSRCMIGQTICPTTPDFMNLTDSCVVCSYGWTQNPFANTGIANSRHTLITTQGFDPNTGNKLPLIPEGDSMSIRLGNPQVGNEAEAITYHFNVQKDTAILMIRFAVVFEDPAHSFESQPRFIIRILDDSDQLLESCMEYDVTASAGIPGFETVKNHWTPILWRPWTTLALDLSPYTGQNIKVQFTNYDCTLHGHFGYAYFTAKCFPSKLNLTACRQSNDTIQLNAPPFCEHYLWTNGDTTPTASFAMRNGELLTASCLIKSFTGCELTLNAQVSDIPLIQDTTIFDTICEGESYIKNNFYLLPQFTVGTHYYINSFYNSSNCSEMVSTFLYLTVIPRFHYINDFTCNGQDYIKHGFNIINPSPGIIRDTQFIPLAIGCDSIVFLTLTVSPFSTLLPEFIVGNSTPCSGSEETYSLSNAEHFVNFQWVVPDDINVIGSRNAETISLQFTEKAVADTLKLYASNGCVDGWASLFIEPKVSYYLTFIDSICEGSAYHENGFNTPRQDSMGHKVFVQNYVSQDGCDSIRTLHLYVFPTPEVEILSSTDVICPDDSVEFQAVSLMQSVDFSMEAKIGDILCTDETIETPESFPASGKTALGVIYWIDPEHTYCWVSDIDYIYTNDGGILGEGIWGDTVLIPNVATVPWPINNVMFFGDTAGYQNTLAMRNYIDSLDDWGLTTSAWTVDFNNGWFLPAAGQAKILASNLPFIYKSFYIAGGAPPFWFTPVDDAIFNWYRIWTSTQESFQIANAININGTIVPLDKHEFTFTWQIRYFKLTK